MPAPTRPVIPPDGNAALEQLFWERRFDDVSLDDVADIPPLADQPTTTFDLTGDRPAIQWRASSLDVGDPPPICWHASR